MIQGKLGSAQLLRGTKQGLWRAGKSAERNNWPAGCIWFFAFQENLEAGIFIWTSLSLNISVFWKLILYVKHSMYTSCMSSLKVSPFPESSLKFFHWYNYPSFIAVVKNSWRPTVFVHSQGNRIWRAQAPSPWTGHKLGGRVREKSRMPQHKGEGNKYPVTSTKSATGHRGRVVVGFREDGFRDHVLQINHKCRDFILRRMLEQWHFCQQP